jgi:dCTP deaminase
MALGGRVVTGEGLMRLVKDGLLEPHPPIEDEGAEDWVIPLHLDDQFIQYSPVPSQPVAVPCNLPTQTIPLGDSGTLTLPPHGAVLGCTAEFVHMPRDHMGWISTKGNLSRGFLMAHVCDGQIDPGYAGKITLELVNLGPLTMDLQAGMAIANLFVVELTSPVKDGYKGRFSSSVAPMPMIER